jgi:cytokinin dehydrogenase
VNISDNEGAYAAYARLSRQLGSSLSIDPDDLTRVSTDFGGLVRRRPRMIVSPRSVEDVLLALEAAREHELPIATRGAGHGQSGQCLSTDAIVLDMSRFAGVLRIDTKERFIDARGGTSWRDIFDAAAVVGLRPIAPTHMLDATIAGTLSVAGVGAESWRAGAQVDNVLELDVATLDGRVLTCDRERHRNLFDAVRAGLGQVGVIVRARYPLGRALPLLRCRSFRYVSAGTYVEDVERVCHESMASFVFGFMTRVGDGRGALVLVLGEECSDTNARPSPLDDLRGESLGAPYHAAAWQRSGKTEHLFYRAADENELSLQPAAVHPWLEFLYASDRAVCALEHALTSAPVDLVLGMNVLHLIARAGVPAPLFVQPPGVGLLWGIGLVPSLTPERGRELIDRLRSFRDTAREHGGKRDLSGYLEFAHGAVGDRARCARVSGDHWATHYGAAWLWFREAKRRWDPRHLLNPGCIGWT